MLEVARDIAVAVLAQVAAELIIDYLKSRLKQERLPKRNPPKHLKEP